MVVAYALGAPFGVVLGAVTILVVIELLLWT